MMLRALSADFLKIRKKGIWLLIFIAPIGLVAMQALNFGLRLDYLMKQYADDLWGGLIDNISFFVPISLYLGVTLVSSLVAGVEHQMSSWKQLLALPISRISVFSAKFTLCFLVLCVSCLLLPLGTALLGLLLGFGTELPYLDLLRMGFASFAAVLPMLALQLWLSLSFRNQSMPVTLGVGAAVISPFTLQLPEWFPLNWPVYAFSGPHAWWFVGAGILCGLAIMVMGMLHFNRKDVD